MAATKRTNLAAVGIMASVASRSHGAVPEVGQTDGRFSPCGGPQDPHAGLYEEPHNYPSSEPPARYAGIADLKTAALTVGDADGEDHSFSQPMRNALGMKSGQTSPAFAQNEYFETSRQD